MTKQILICSTVARTIEAFLIPHIKLLKGIGYEIDVAANFSDQTGNTELGSLVRKSYDLPFQRTPFSGKNFKAARELKSIASKNNYDIVHFHTPIASAFGRFYIRGLRKEGLRILYTAHGFHFYKGAPIKNWIIYYPMEKFLSGNTDLLITINEEDYSRAGEKLNQKELIKMPGVGIDTGKYADIEIDWAVKRKEIGVPDNAVLLISVGELNENKNHKVIIEAIPQLKTKKVYYVICGEGPEKNDLIRKTEDLDIADRVFLLGQREDVNELLKVSDLFVFPSKREGLPVSVMEAMAAGLPVIASKIRGNMDLVVENEGGFLIDSVLDWSGVIDGFINHKEIRDSYSRFNLKRIRDFDIENILEQLRKIY